MNFKAILGKKIHRLPQGLNNFDKLLFKIRTIFSQILPDQYTFKYEDSDKDWINLESQEDFEAAICFFKEKNINSMKIKIVKCKKPALDQYVIKNFSEEMSQSRIIKLSKKDDEKEDLRESVIISRDQNKEEQKGDQNQNKLYQIYRGQQMVLNQQNNFEQKQQYVLQNKEEYQQSRNSDVGLNTIQNHLEYQRAQENHLEYQRAQENQLEYQQAQVNQKVLELNQSQKYQLTLNEPKMMIEYVDEQKIKTLSRNYIPISKNNQEQIAASQQEQLNKSSQLNNNLKYVEGNQEEGKEDVAKQPDSNSEYFQNKMQYSNPNNFAIQNPVIQANNNSIVFQKQETNQNCKESDLLKNIMINSYDLTLKKKQKSQILQKYHSRQLANGLLKISNQEKSQRILIAYQKNSSKFSELDLSDYFSQMNQQQFDQTKKESIRVSTVSQEFFSEKKYTAENSQIIAGDTFKKSERLSKQQLKQKKEDDIQKQENKTQYSNNIKVKEIDDFSEHETQQDMSKKDQIQQQINSKQNDVLCYDPFYKYLQENQKSSLENKENIKYNNNYQQISFQQFLTLDQENYKHILNEFESYQFQEYEPQDQTETQFQIGNFKERKFNLDAFNNINKSSIKNKLFKQMENEIIEELQQRDFYLSKLLNSNEKQDLFIGYEEQDQFQYENELIQIKYNMTQSELDITQLMFEALQLEYKKIDFQQNNTYIFVLSINHIENLQFKLTNFNQVINEVFNFSKTKKHIEITIKKSIQQEKSQSLKMQIDFLFTFLKNQKYFLCEFKDQQIKGIMLKAEFQQIVQQLQDFLIQQIFNISLKDNDFTQQNQTNTQNIIQEIEVISDNVNSRREKINYQKSMSNQNQKHTSKHILGNQNYLTQSEEQEISRKFLLDFLSKYNQEETTLRQQEALQQNIDTVNQNNSINVNNLELKDLIQKCLEIKIYQQIIQYDINEYLTDEQQPNYIGEDVNKIELREWNEAKFQATNEHIEFNNNLKANLQLLFEVLQNKNYYLCKNILSNENENIFIGYQSISNQVYVDYIFLIIQNYTQKDIEEYFQEKYPNQEINQFILKQNQFILVLKKDFLISYQKNLIFKRFNNLFCDKCKQDNQNKINCEECKLFYKLINNQDIILEKMQQKNYYLKEYLNKGGFGIIFQGVKCSLLEYQEVVFKIQFDEDIQDEIKIMKIFEHNQNVITYLDHIKIKDKVDVLVLEKCKYSLAQELQYLTNNQTFPKRKLLKMIKQLTEGLVLFRIYNILHLDIKPGNILVTSSGNYVFTDFGISSLKIKNQQAKVKGYSIYYASPEQIQECDEENSSFVDFYSDIYSLGKTFKKIIDCYNKLQPQDQETYNFFNSLIQDHMVKQNKDQRKDCLDLLQQILEKFFQNEDVLLFANALHFLDLNEYDQNKDNTSFLNIKLKYYQCYLSIIKASEKNCFLEYKSKLEIKSTFLNEMYICFENLGQYQSALKYQQECLKIVEQIYQGNHPRIAQTFNNLGICFLNLCDYQKALDYHLKSLNIRKQLYKENHPEIAKSLYNACLCYLYLGNNQKALEYSLQSLKICQQNFNQNHSQTAYSLQIVSRCYQNVGDNQKAFEYSQESLKIRLQIFKENHPDIADSFSSIRDYYYNIGEYQKALENQLESHKILQQIFKQDHQKIASSLKSLGNCYLHLGENQKALEYFLDSLEMRKQIFGQIHPEIADSLCDVGICFISLGDNLKSLEYSLESLKMRKQIFIDNHPPIAHSLNNVGICYIRLGDYQIALEYQLESLKIRKQHLEEFHPDIAVSLQNICICYTQIGENQLALKYVLECLKIYKQKFSENNPNILNILVLVCECYKKLDDYQMLLKYLLESLQITKQIFKQIHPDIASSLQEVSICYQNLGDYQTALEYQLESFQMLQQIFKEDNPQIASSLYELSICYLNIEYNEKALEYSLESLKMRKQLFKQIHPDIASSLYNVSNCYINLGEYQKALEYSLESLQMRKQIFKEIDPHIAQSLNNVGKCYLKMNENQKALEYLLECHKIYKQTFKKNQYEIAYFFTDVSNCYQKLGDNQKSLEYELESLKLFQQIFKEIHPDIAKCLNNIGKIYYNIGNIKMALQYLLESLKMKKKIFKEKHPSIAESLFFIGDCYKTLGDNQNALDYFLKSVKMRKQIFKQNHPDIALSLNQVGLIYLSLGDYQKSLQYLLESLEIRQHFQKELNQQIVMCISNIGSNYLFLNDIKMANEYFTQFQTMFLNLKQCDKELLSFAKNYIDNIQRNLYHQLDMTIYDISKAERIAIVLK